MRSRQAARQLQVAAAQPHRRGLHAILREDGRGVGGQAADDQREIVLRRPGECRRRRRSRRSRAAASSGLALLSFHFRSIAGRLRNRPRSIRFRPSSWTSTSSSAPVPAVTTGGFTPPAYAGRPRCRAGPQARFPDVQLLPAKRGVRARPRLQSAHLIVDRPRGARPIDDAVFFLQQAAHRWPARGPASRGRCVPAVEPASVSTKQVRAHRGEAAVRARPPSPRVRSRSPPSAACRRCRAPRRSAWWSRRCAFRRSRIAH